MPPDRGLFLEHTRRLHPDLCRFTSEVSELVAKLVRALDARGST